mmetsp:Transcript_18722/g.25377  ORF Transcript_18722/g.25377 Transcript_18722/m.25377 type:complete len:105 (-) Transcript_18722:207-521(-)
MVIIGLMWFQSALEQEWSANKRMEYKIFLCVNQPRNQSFIADGSTVKKNVSGVLDINHNAPLDQKIRKPKISNPGTRRMALRLMWARRLLEHVRLRRALNPRWT